VSKILRLLTMSLLLGSIMIASFAGAVFADDQDQVRLQDGSCCEDPCDGPVQDRIGQEE